MAHYKDQVIKVLLDNSSNSSIITIDAAKRLNLESKSSEEDLHVYTMSESTLKTSETVKVPLSSYYNRPGRIPGISGSIVPTGLVKNRTSTIRSRSFGRVQPKKDEGDEPEGLEFFVVDTHVTIDKPCIDLDDLWPNLDDKLKLQAIENMIDRQVDVIIGPDPLYRKITDTKSIPHPDRGLALLNTKFGWSLGGSPEKKKV